MAAIPGMLPFAHGIVPVSTEDYLSMLLEKCESNQELLESKQFESLFFQKYGPYTLGGIIKLEIRVYPLGGETLHIYVHVLVNEKLVKNFSSVVTYYHVNGWVTATSPIYGAELTPRGKISEGLGLPMVFVEYFNGSYGWYQADYMLVQIVLWFALDDSKILTPVLQPVVAKPSHDQLENTYIVVGDQTFSAHRAVLEARSSVFQSEFRALQPNIRQEGRFLLSIKHMDALTFKYLLHFIYTDSLPPENDDPPNPLESYRRLFIAAHRFNIHGLKRLCETKLSKNVTNHILSILEMIDFQDSGLLEIN